MAVVALVALNCAALRAIVPSQGRPQLFEIFLIGLLPLANAAIIGMVFLALWYRFSLQRRFQRDRIGMLPGFAIASALGLIVMGAACVFAQEEVLQYLQFVLRPVDVFLRSLGFNDSDYDRAVFRFVTLPLMLGASLSGPTLLLALAVGWMSNRYRVAIIRRKV